MSTLNVPLSPVAQEVLNRLPQVPLTGLTREDVAIICQEICATMIVRNATSPAIPTKPPAPPAAVSSSGQFCPKCGGVMVRTGTCLTCQSCGDTSGGCS